MKKKIAILLPNKEDFTKDNAGAASLWVKNYNKYSFFKETLIFGNSTSKNYLSKNFVNLDKKSIFYNSKSYLNEFLNKAPQSIKLIEIHNRPHFFILLKKINRNYKFILIFHNDPNLLRGSKTVEEKLFILKNCDEIIFISKFVKERFYYNLTNYLPIKGKIIYHSIKYNKSLSNKFPKKKKIIIFCGKLNSAKGYDVFGKAIIKILNKYKTWSSIVAGNEKRETYNYKHENLKIYDWISHEKILNLYKKSSISLVPSAWQEPFGRTAMESSDLGNALITSGFGGLKETSHNQIIINKINEKKIFIEIEKLIKNKKKLKKIQLKNFFNRKINFQENLDNLNLIKKNIINPTLYTPAILYKKVKVLHISNFDERSNYRLENINLANKISNGLILNNYQVFNFSDRYFKTKNNFISLDNKVIDITKNIKPDVLLMGHTNSLNNETLRILKEKNPAIKISFWYEDSVNKYGPDYEKNKEFTEKYKEEVENFFITTHPSAADINIDKNKIHFMPVPCSIITENYNLFKSNNHKYDIFFAVSHGVNRGILKENKTDERFSFIKELSEKLINYNFNIFGFNNIQPIWGDSLIREISQSRFALNLSRGTPVKYYSSNRISTLIANGMPTLIDKRVCLQDFLSNDEIILYEDIDEIIEKVNFFKKNDTARKKIGEKGKLKYFKLFNNTIVADYIISKTLDQKPKFKYCWDR
jgi:glycosyltransferase involved in cell wall biosynthesis